MKCDKCDRPATVHLTEITKDGQKITKNLCEIHAMEEGIMVNVIDTDFDSDMPISELLEKFVLKNTSTIDVTPQTLECDQCGLTYAQFRKMGLLGCPNCYTAFEEPLTTVLKQVQDDAIQHVGKVPRDADNKTRHQQQLMQLRRELEEAISNEQYERAAKLRDEVREVEEEGK